MWTEDWRGVDQSDGMESDEDGRLKAEVGLAVYPLVLIRVP